ncbi:MAG: hypothetical protein H8F28_19140 [Fibrella sp.]|nr:hypothetical protein [Armatimonadota bacterium]
MNIETDILGKYVEKMLGGYGVTSGASTPADPYADRLARERGGVSMDLLSRSGYVATATEEAPSRYGGYGGSGNDW